MLRKNLSHLPESNIAELEAITTRIVNTGKAEMVILYGSYARGNYREERGKTRGKKSDYDILVITRDTDTQKELRSGVRRLFDDIGVTVQLIVEKIDFVNSNLEEKQYFFTDIKREGKILYDSGKCKLAEAVEPTPVRRREMAEDDFKRWFKQANDFYWGFENFYKANKNQIASFHLQQTVEMCYTAIEMVFTHYNTHEHYLKILRKRCMGFDRRVKKAFPMETPEQIELFDYLDFAYIGGRYRSEEEYPVSRKQLDYWGQEASKLLVLTESICRERIACLKAIEDNC